MQQVFATEKGILYSAKFHKDYKKRLIIKYTIKSNYS